MSPLDAGGRAAPPPEALKLFHEAEAHEGAGRLEEAEATLEQVLALAPDFAPAIHAQGIIAARRGQLDAAAALMERSLQCRPVPAYFQRNLCEIYRQLRRYDEALKAGKAAVAADPKDFLAHVNLAVLLYARGEPDASIASAEQALALKPEAPGAHFALAEAYLLKGELAKGWEEYEWRFRMPGVPPLLPEGAPPQWQGETLEGKRLLLVADQGFGDCIQFARYIPWAASRAGEVALACSPELKPLIGGVSGVAKAFVRWEDCPKADAHLPLSGLPRLHGTTLANAPADIPYLATEPERRARWARRLEELCASAHRRIGLVWAGRPTHKNDANRSTTLAALEPLGASEGVTFVALQKGGPETQIAGWFAAAPLVNLGPELESFADTAAALESLDLVISVDTAVGHLAGALGRPIWLMLAHVPDWRWLQERADSPWYPSLRLFRQSAHGDWPGVVAAVGRALADL
ncbi:MAG TPA: tetratricopeptide repeat protein [Caulobacteraceae bacterium]|nr:tetratricopeptide repeat protein [Caulobacteraceae bacterium]